ncbi:MAG: alanine--glyoxylate aminotransferase family protein [Chloroflexi bacterium]|nr:alanine--glyoxylate aminotransferase family protein [Chloroflexota bacterium]MBV9899412.1 alanine--glyoxylate aminotransferase family protein [Chloroflexota bacterium]
MASQNLRTPGPTPLPPAVREALARDMVNHRGPEFAAVLNDCVEGLKWAYQVSEHDMVILTASGTGGLESLVANTLSPGDKLLVASIGNFGERMGQIARTFEVDVTQLDFQPGNPVDPQRLEDALREDPDIGTVFITHNETSTGVLNPLRDLAAAVRATRPEALLLVDGISSVSSVEIRPEDWDLDVVVAGSQKGWMVPPGLAFVSISPRAWERQSQAKLPRFYFDWRAAQKSAQNGETPWTPAVSLFYALQVGLQLMREEGLQQIFARHQRLAKFTREGLSELDLRLLADPRFASPTVTTAYLPDGISGKGLLRTLDERYGVVLAGGQGNLSGKIFRIGHMGWVTEDDLSAVLSALKLELNSVRATATAGR